MFSDEQGQQAFKIVFKDKRVTDTDFIQRIAKIAENSRPLKIKAAIFCVCELGRNENKSARTLRDAGCGAVITSEQCLDVQASLKVVEKFSKNFVKEKVCFFFNNY